MGSYRQKSASWHFSLSWKADMLPASTNEPNYVGCSLGLMLQSSSFCSHLLRSVHMQGDRECSVTICCLSSKLLPSTAQQSSRKEWHCQSPWMTERRPCAVIGTERSTPAEHSRSPKHLSMAEAVGRDSNYPTYKSLRFTFRPPSRQKLEKSLLNWLQVTLISATCKPQ